MPPVSHLQGTDIRGTHIENLNIGTAVDSSTNVDTLLLTTRQGDTAFTNLCEVTVGEEFQVRIQARVGNGLPVPIRIKRSTEANVIADGSILQTVQYNLKHGARGHTHLNPRVLRTI